MKRLLIFIVIPLLGCASTKWVKSDVSVDQITKDQRECDMYGDAHSEMNPFLSLSLSKQCMENKGYEKVSR